MSSLRVVGDTGRARSAVVVAGAMLVLLLAVPAGAQGPDSAVPLDPLSTIATRDAVTIHPRVLTAYATLMAAAVMGVLYLYRRRAFILYWLGSCLLLAAALGVMSWFSGPGPGTAITGVALLSLALAAVLLRLAAEAFPPTDIRWRTAGTVAAVCAGWCLGVPLLAPAAAVINGGLLIIAGLLGWAAVKYVTIARLDRHVGAAIIALGLCIVTAVTGTAVVLAVGLSIDDSLMNRLAAVNIVTSVFVTVGMLLLIFEELTAALQRAHRDLAAATESTLRQSNTDPLTGCQNRLFFDDIERREIKRHRRYGIPLSVVFIDVNRLKQLNDTEGHERGDEALRTIGFMLRREVRQTDYVIRWGGDEFLLLLACPLPVAQYKAIGLKEAFREESELAHLPGQLGLSVGVAEVAADAEDLQDAIREADAAMYRDKLGERTSLQVR